MAGIAMTSINNQQSLTSNLLSSNAAADDQSVSVFTSIGESFSEFFSQSQEASSDLSVATSAESTLALTTDNVSDNLGTMQNELLASLLGYNSAVTALASSQSDLNEISEFSLDSYKELMQENFLGELQSNSIASAIAQLPEGEEVTTDTSFVTELIHFSFNDDGLGMEDAYDVLNVLEHIPVVSSFYQSAKDQEEIGVVSQLAGDFLYGGSVGLAYSVLDLAVEGLTGTSINDAIAGFDYSGFLFSDDVTEVESPEVTEKPTLFFDKNNEVIGTRE